MIEDATSNAGLPEWLYVVLWINVLVAAIWVMLTLVVYMRRKASNLTPVNVADAKKSAAPDFLNVDHKARQAQIARGEAFEKDLSKREKAEDADGHKARQASWWRRLAGFATLLISVFSLVSTAIGVIGQVDRIGGALKHTDQLGVIVQKYPIPFAVCAFVISYYVVMFFVQKQWSRVGK